MSSWRWSVGFKYVWPICTVNVRICGWQLMLLSKMWLNKNTSAITHTVDICRSLLLIAYVTTHFDVLQFICLSLAAVDAVDFSFSNLLMETLYLIATLFETGYLYQNSLFILHAYGNCYIVCNKM